jgi:hypothetical protein
VVIKRQAAERCNFVLNLHLGQGLVADGRSTIRRPQPKVADGLVNVGRSVQLDGELAQAIRAAEFEFDTGPRHTP